MKIGGNQAKPILTKWKWFAISICTTIATGILFWGTAEPILHMYNPGGDPIDNPTSASAVFSLSTMFMHWTLTPYAIYCIAAIVFAIGYYNHRQSFSLATLLYPITKKPLPPIVAQLIDAICLFSLVAGMGASLGAGILSISGGLEFLAGIASSKMVLLLIALVIIIGFTSSAITGLQKGIKILSDINIKAFIILAIIVFMGSPIIEVLSLALDAVIDYFVYFISRSTLQDDQIAKEWSRSWTCFYWANWMAWAPISALFLGRLAVGYTVRQMIHCNLLLPALFGAIWMIIFGGATIQFDMLTGGQIHSVLQELGVENVSYAVFGQLPFGRILSVIFLIIVVLSYITAADSNTTAMSAICTDGITAEQSDSPIWIKVIWGFTIGALAFVMVSTSGIEGIKQLSNLGGFPALFLLIGVGIGAFKMCWLSLKRTSISE